MNTTSEQQTNRERLTKRVSVIRMHANKRGFKRLNYRNGPPSDLQRVTGRVSGLIDVLASTTDKKELDDALERLAKAVKRRPAPVDPVDARRELWKYARNKHYEWKECSPCGAHCGVKEYLALITELAKISNRDEDELVATVFADTKLDPDTDEAANDLDLGQSRLIERIESICAEIAQRHRLPAYFHHVTRLGLTRDMDQRHYEFEQTIDGFKDLMSGFYIPVLSAGQETLGGPPFWGQLPSVPLYCVRAGKPVPLRVRSKADDTTYAARLCSGREVSLSITARDSSGEGAPVLQFNDLIWIEVDDAESSVHEAPLAGQRLTQPDKYRCEDYELDSEWVTESGEVVPIELRDGSGDRNDVITELTEAWWAQWNQDWPFDQDIQHEAEYRALNRGTLWRYLVHRPKDFESRECLVRSRFTETYTDDVTDSALPLYGVPDDCVAHGLICGMSRTQKDRNWISKLEDEAQRLVDGLEQQAWRDNQRHEVAALEDDLDAPTKPITTPGEWRKAMRYTQDEAAQALGVSKRTWCNWERAEDDRRPPTAAVLAMELWRRDPKTASQLRDLSTGRMGPSA